MNVFVTDHPLSSDSNRSNAKVAVLVIAVMLCPFLLALFWFTNGIWNGDTTDYGPPDPFWEVLVNAVVGSLVVAVVVVALYRLGCWLWRKECGTAHSTWVQPFGTACDKSLVRARNGHDRRGCETGPPMGRCI
jgi:hypothetical protein